MRKPIDLSGKKFGRLVPLELMKEGYKRPTWKCRCDCGNMVYVRGDHLRSGHTQSCGCYQKERTSNTCTNDLLGKRFGKWTVIGKTEKRLYNFVIWKCKCDCGTIAEVVGISLTSGRSQSCGCQKSRGEDLIAKLLEEHNIPFEKQKTFNTCRFPDTNYLAFFDFWVDGKYLIEYDGK